MEDYSYIGSGIIYGRIAGSAAAMLDFGNCSKLDFGITEDVKELKDFTKPGGGTYNEVRRIQAVEAKISAHDLNAANMARATLGTASSISVTPIVDESHIAYAGGFIPTNFPAAGAIVVKEGIATLVENTDYTVVPGGIVVITGGALSDGNTALLSYTPAAGNKVEALLNSSQEYELFFSGLNEARSGKAVHIHAYRVKLGAAGNLSLIGEEYAVIELTGKLLKDSTKNGTTVSQYFKASIVA